MQTSQNKNAQARVKAAMRTAKQDVLDFAAVGAARMMDDPCDAVLTETVYPGERGYLNRFAMNGSLGQTTGNTVVVFLYKPGNGVAYYNELPSDATSFTTAFGNTVPGNAFLAANATKSRCAAFCSSIRPIASAANVTGTIHFGMVAASAVANGTTFTAAGLINLLPESVSASQALYAPLEVKWCPGDVDDTYSPWPAIISDDDSDRTVLVVVARGLVAGSGVQYKNTAIWEWVPQLTTGIAQDPTSVRSSSADKEDVLRYLKRKDANWWWGLGKKTAKMGGKIVRGYVRGGVVGALGALM